ncbi:MAG: TerD family protein [Planctomycetaceae bacterium]|jgi:stress response protein SCP2|nr:TerD family protein [Planctomycetaceae bacterium]
MDPLSLLALGLANGLMTFVNGMFSRNTQEKMAVKNSEIQTALQEKNFEEAEKNRQLQKSLQEKNFAEADRLQKELKQIDYQNALALQDESFRKQLAMAEYIYFRDNEWTLIPSPESHVNYLKQMYSPDRVPLQIIITDAMPQNFGGVRKDVSKFFDEYYSLHSDSPALFYDQGWKESMKNKNGNAQIIALHKALAGLPTLIIASDFTSDGEGTEMNIRASFWGLGETHVPVSKYLFEKNIKGLEQEIPDKKLRQQALSSLLQISAAAVADMYHLLHYGKQPLLPKICNEWNTLNNDTARKVVADLFGTFLLTEVRSEVPNIDAPLQLALTATAFYEAGSKETARKFANQAIEHFVSFAHKGTIPSLGKDHYRALELLKPLVPKRVTAVTGVVKQAEPKRIVESCLPLATLRVVLSWSDSEFDLDLSAFLLNAAGKAVDAVYYGKTKSKCKGIIHSVDERGGAGAEELMTVTLNQIDKTVQRIVFVVTEKTGHSLGGLSNGTVQIFDSAHNKKLASLHFAGIVKQCCTVKFCEIVRTETNWEFMHSTEENLSRLPQIAEEYGITIEGGKTPADTGKVSADAPTIDENISFDTLLKLAKQGNAEGQWRVGLCYLGGDGVTENAGEAVKWFRKSAEQGYAGGQCWLGICFQIGRGVPQNYNEAVQSYQNAANQGYADAQFQLYICYRNGYGVPQNDSLASDWLIKARDGGSLYALTSCLLQTFCIFPLDRIYIKQLVDDGADINDKYSDGGTVLHSLMSHSSVTASDVQFALSLGADPDIQNGNGDTPLHIAVRDHWEYDIVRCLHHHNTNTANIRNNDGETPMDEANGRLLGQSDIVKILQGR